MSLFKSLLKNCGFKQISVLTSLLIISLVLILAIIWQTHVANTEYDKFNNKIASILANDIANRMQLNYQESIKGKSSFYVHSTSMTQNTIVKQHTDSYCDKKPEGCPTDTIAANDLAYWQQAIHENLPNGTGEIDFVANNSNYYSINIRWQNLSNNKKRMFTTNVLLPIKPWQYICDLNKHHSNSMQEYNNQHKTQIIYDTIMGNKHNYKNFDFTATIFNDYIDKIDNINLSLADELCVASCKSLKNLAGSSNLCDCQKEHHYHSINFICNNHENN